MGKQQRQGHTEGILSNKPKSETPEKQSVQIMAYYKYERKYVLSSMSQTTPMLLSPPDSNIARLTLAIVLPQYCATCFSGERLNA